MRRIILAAVIAAALASAVTAYATTVVRWPAACTKMACVNNHLNALQGTDTTQQVKINHAWSTANDANQTAAKALATAQAGVPGPQGPQGPQGPSGPQGAQGVPGGLSIGDSVLIEACNVADSHPTWLAGVSRGSSNECDLSVNTTDDFIGRAPYYDCAAQVIGMYQDIGASANAANTIAITAIDVLRDNVTGQPDGLKVSVKFWAINPNGGSTSVPTPGIIPQDFRITLDCQ